ncbi:sodium:proton antiporter [Hyphomonas sp. FCG-A18]|uniref:cation:proton antiporter n=1 Tax=Hyphomonas sp. FCG-A18 TaxID=3080019 RepID=UPI002B313335|nr:sodium:proton antiporter [Hyphomonas sp. FCG-A18]
MDLGILLAGGAGGDVIVACALIGTLGLGAQWLAWRLQAPAIVLMSLAGLAVGPLWSVLFGDPLLNPSESFGDVFRPIVSLAVAVILFEGGLVLKFENLREAGKPVRRMIFVGGPLAWVLGTFAARYAAGLDWASAVVFAGVMVVTGPTVIMPLLRQSKLGGRPAQFLKWEGIVNDPIGALFAVAAFEIVRVASQGDNTVAAAAWIIFAAVEGIILGIIFGWIMIRAFRNGWAPEYLKAPLILGSIILCYALAELVEREIGLVAVTAYGMMLGNSKLAGLTELRKFKEDIAVLLVSGVFVMLTADLTPQIIGSAINMNTLLFLICMLFIVRPLSVWISTAGTLERNEALLLGWIAPRGIVAVAVSGLFGSLLIDLDRVGRFDFEGADQIAPLAFAMVFTTVVLHGFTIGPLARALGLARRERPGVLIVGANAWSLEFTKALQASKVDVIIADSSYRRLRPAREAGLDVFLGEVLSEDAEIKLDHARFSAVAALSTNDSYNSLVCSHFAPELGRHMVHQLSLSEAEESDEKVASLNARGRTLIRRGRTYDGLVRDQYRGWTFSRTGLTDKYTLEQFREDRPQADIVAEIRPDGSLVLIGPNREARGGDGTTLISFAPEVSQAPDAAPEMGGLALS